MSDQTGATEPNVGETPAEPAQATATDGPMSEAQRREITERIDGTVFRGEDGTPYQVVPRTGRRPKGEPPKAGVRSEQLGSQVEVTMRRAPKIRVFLAVGFIVGLVVAGVLQVLGPGMGSGSLDFSKPLAIYATLACIVCPITTLVAAVVALVLDRSSKPA